VGKKPKRSSPAASPLRKGEGALRGLQHEETERVYHESEYVWRGWVSKTLGIVKACGLSSTRGKE